MEHTAERYTDCFETFLREPNEATYTQVCAERYRRKQSGQSVDRREERSRFSSCCTPTSGSSTRCTFRP